METEVEKFSKRLDEIFEQGMPTKAQIIDAFIKFSPAKGPVKGTEKITDDHRELRDIVLAESEKGNVICATFEGLMTVPIEEIIKQPLEGLLYDLNRDVGTILTLINDPKWVNDFAVCKVISKLYTLAFPKDAKELVSKAWHDAVVKTCDDLRAENIDLKKQIANIIKLSGEKIPDIATFTSTGGMYAKEPTDIMYLLNKYTTTSLSWMAETHQNICIDPMDYHKIADEFSHSKEPAVTDGKFYTKTVLKNIFICGYRSAEGKRSFDDSIKWFDNTYKTDSTKGLHGEFANLNFK